MANPKKALAAFNAAPISIDGIDVQPISLRYAAVLEAIGSPVVTGVTTGVLSCWTGTLFVMTRPAGESRALLATGRDAFDAAVDVWAGEIPAGTAVKLIQAVLRQTRIAMGVNPDGDGDEPKNRSRATAG